MRFQPQAEVLASFPGFAPIEALENECASFGGSGCYAASPSFIRDHGGLISNRILAAIPQEYFDKCFSLGMLPNVRIHRLNEGEYPAVPGWHCDGVLRETYFAQPDASRIRVRDTYVIGYVNLL